MTSLNFLLSPQKCQVPHCCLYVLAQAALTTHGESDHVKEFSENTKDLVEAKEFFKLHKLDV